MKSEQRSIPASGQPAAYGQEILKRRYRRTISHCPVNTKTILDFGCGNGAQTIEFAGAAGRILALDVDYNSLEIFSSELKRTNVRTVLPVQYAGGQLPVADESVDIVLSFEVLEHVSDETLALREIHRVLKPGGEAVISVPNKAWIFETHGARLPLLRWNRVPLFSWLPKPIHDRYSHARIYRRKEITRLLEAHALKPRSSEYITAPMDVVKIGWLKRFLRSTLFASDTTMIPMLSTSILVHCVK